MNGWRPTNIDGPMQSSSPDMMYSRPVIAEHEGWIPHSNSSSIMAQSDAVSLDVCDASVVELDTVVEPAVALVVGDDPFVCWPVSVWPVPLAPSAPVDSPSFGPDGHAVKPGASNSRQMDGGTSLTTRRIDVDMNAGQFAHACKRFRPLAADGPVFRRPGLNTARRSGHGHSYGR